MKPHRISTFKNPTEAENFLEEWNRQIETLNGFSYERLTISTSFGNTRIWAANTHLTDAKTIVFFPGARTCGLFWDMDNALKPFRENHRFYIVDVNGQPGLSAGTCPRLKSSDYGVWATELLDGLGLKKTTIVGASLGGLICLKLCLESPRRVKKAILLNPAGIQSFSTSISNLYYNLLPIVWPTLSNLNKFLNKAILCPPHHAVPTPYRNLLCEYLLYALFNHKFRGDYPAPLEKEELHRLTTEIYLILGEKDLLFPPDETIRLAEEHILTLQGSQILPNTSHGIETSKEALELVWHTINKSVCYAY
ncbi:alpha/beta fold hydrolase [Larkinella rosea]|nr:alpha/beta hydrolase [Larkinella rosea]